LETLVEMVPGLLVLGERVTGVQGTGLALIAFGLIAVNAG